MDLDGHAHALERQHHVRADVLQAVHGRHREVALLVTRLVAQVLFPVRAFLAAVPEPFLGIDVIIAVVVGLVEADAVQDIELGFRPEVGAFGHAAGFQVRLGLVRHVSRVPRIVFAGDGIADVANEAERWSAGEGVDEGCAGIGKQQHVALVDRLKAANAGAVKSHAFGEGVFSELPGRDREVLPQAGEVHELQVDDLNPFVLDHLDHFFSCHIL